MNALQYLCGFVYQIVNLCAGILLREDFLVTITMAFNSTEVYLTKREERNLSSV